MNIPNPLEVKTPEYRDAFSKPSTARRPRKQLALPPLPADIEKKLMEQERKLGVSDKAPTCKNKNLTITPSLNDLREMNDKELSAVRNFRIHCESVGTLEFLEPVDLRSVAIDEVAMFNNSSIQLYEQAELPAVGEGLNQRARITLESIFPKKKDDPERMKRYVERLKSHCEKTNSEFVDYSPKSGRWVFIVEHF